MSVWVTSSLKTHFSTQMNFTVIKLIKTVCHGNEKSGSYTLTKFTDGWLALGFNGNNVEKLNDKMHIAIFNHYTSIS